MGPNVNAARLDEDGYQDSSLEYHEEGSSQGTDMGSWLVYPALPLPKAPW